jgi:putative NADH-flavin reductase
MDKPYKIAIIGGTGKVGRYIATKALQKGYQVRLLVRNPERLAYRDDRLEVVEGNIQDIETIRKLLKDCQIVINTLGQPLKEIPIYSSVTENILKVMKGLQIDRYIGVTGGSLTIKGDNKRVLNRFGAKMFEIFFSKMMVDKKKEWHILFNNKLINWTLIRLPFVVDGSEIGNVKENLTDMPGIKITNKDIATFIINQIENQKYVHKAPFISN